MTSHHFDLRPVRWGVMFALLSIFFGYVLGGIFGANEAALKNDLTARAETVRDAVYQGDEAAMKGVIDKAWAYYKRAHLHGGGIGATSLGCMILLAGLPRGAAWLKAITALAMGLGSLGYSVYWLLAALRAPGMGSTGAAKESLDWLAIPSASALTFGLMAVMGMTAFALFTKRRDAA